MPPSPPPPILACLFDMDGLLIDSEDLYTIVTNTVLRRYNKPDLPWSIKAKMQGRPGPSAGKVFQDWAQLPVSREDFMAQTAALQREHFPTTRPLPGVEELMGKLAASGVEIALATSSHRGNFDIKTKHLARLFSVFAEEQRVLGDDPRIPAGRGKPAPDIYLLALETVNAKRRRDGQADIKPEQCLVFEDSVPGVESGRRAGMQVVWCPHPGLLNEYRGREEAVLAGLTGESEDAGSKPGELGDGWAVLYQSLENFPYERYGIKV